MDIDKLNYTTRLLRAFMMSPCTTTRCKVGPCICVRLQDFSRRLQCTAVASTTSVNCHLVCFRSTATCHLRSRPSRSRRLYAALRRSESRDAALPSILTTSLPLRQVLNVADCSPRTSVSCACEERVESLRLVPHARRLGFVIR